MNRWQERNEPVIKAFRENGGKVTGMAPLILLTTTGAKTGQPQVRKNRKSGDAKLADEFLTCP